MGMKLENRDELMFMSDSLWQMYLTRIQMVSVIQPMLFLNTKHSIIKANGTQCSKARERCLYKHINTKLFNLIIIGCTS